ncbi:MAG TPA: flagellar brake protein [Gammaproteobacteria bacterium]|nr:flagellar brake protein [Gammaproteobacteria bacterium]
MEEDDKLKLTIGDALQLQFVADEQKRRHYSKVIGYLEGHSVLITTPRVEGNIMLVREDQRVIVRMMTGNQVYGFNTQITSSNLRPYAYLHLAYPKELEHITVRKAQRVTTRLIASAELETAENAERVTHPVSVIDVSTNGAMFESAIRLGEVGDIITLSAKLKVGEKEEYISIPCIIRNIKQTGDSGKINHGLEYQLLEQNEHFIIYGYVYEQMINSMKK